jgi:hypothetical protein
MGPGESSGICRVTDMSDRILYARWFARGDGGQAQPPRNGKARCEHDRHKTGLSGPDSIGQPKLPPGNGSGPERQNRKRHSHKRDHGDPRRLILQCLEGINSALG